MPEKVQEGLRLLFQKGETTWHARSIVRLLLLVVEKASGRRIKRFHDLRHFHASMLIAQGENPKYIQNQLGHASITTNFDIYGHVMRQDAASKSGSIVKAGEVPLRRKSRRKIKC